MCGGCAGGLEIACPRAAAQASVLMPACRRPAAMAQCHGKTRLGQVTGATCCHPKGRARGQHCATFGTMVQPGVISGGAQWPRPASAWPLANARAGAGIPKAAESGTQAKPRWPKPIPRGAMNCAPGNPRPAWGTGLNQHHAGERAGARALARHSPRRCFETRVAPG